MPPVSPVKIVYGCSGSVWFNDETNGLVLELLKQVGVREVDSARGYGASEEKLGLRRAAQSFIISTKFSGQWGNRPANRENIQRSMAKSLALLQTQQVRHQHSFSRI